MSRELYETVVDEKIDNGLQLLFTPTQQKMLINLITLLITINDWDTYEESVLTILLTENPDTASVSDGILDTIVTATNEVLTEKGIKISNPSLTIINSVVITFNELMNVTHDVAEELIEYFDNYDVDDEWVIASIVDHYSTLDSMTVYEAIEYITPTLIKKIHQGLINLVDNADNEVLVTLDPIVNRSRIYTLLEPTDKLEGSVLMDVYYEIFNSVNDTAVLANELYVVIKFTKDIENSMYYLTSEIEDDLLSLVSGDVVGVAKVNDVISRTKILIKDI